MGTVFGKIIIFIIAIMITAGMVFFVYKAVGIERDTFNRCQGANVTWGEAAFTELRVQECN